jgi:hypothetical protein
VIVQCLGKLLGQIDPEKGIQNPAKHAREPDTSPTDEFIHVDDVSDSVPGALDRVKFAVRHQRWYSRSEGCSKNAVISAPVK